AFEIWCHMIRWILAVSFMAIGCTRERGEPVSPSKPAPEKPAIARLREPKSAVELKRHDTLAWGPAQTDAALFKHDMVKTGAGSSCRVEFTEGGTLDISEKSTVTISDFKSTESKTEATVSLPAGRVRGDLEGRGDKAVELTIRTRRGWVRIAGQDAQGRPSKSKFEAVVNEAGETHVNLETGRAVLVTKERELELAPGETLTVAASGESAAEGESADEAPPAIAENAIQRKGGTSEAPKSTRAHKAADVAKAAQAGDHFEILEPRSGAEVSAAEIKIKGRARGSLKAYLNGKPVAPVNGAFEVRVALKEGLNLLIFQVVNTKTNAVSLHNLEVTRK
ncbi:MAG TPA: FecR domain-containing protein, partial [Bdellovibrionales bacterium]|nr:FecR domain-containing protein [Bdellovibrionales bacterium]